MQDALKAGLEASVVPAFEMSCKAMFEQVDSTFRKGMVEHTTAAKQHFESAHSSLALALRVCTLCHITKIIRRNRERWGARESRGPTHCSQN